MDQAPGPRRIKLNPIAAHSSDGQNSSSLENAIQSSIPTAVAPAIGVHKPISKKAAAPAATTPNALELPSPGTRRKNPRMRNAEIANLRTISPNPGQPFANVENRRCRVSPLRDYAISAGEETSIESSVSPFRVKLQTDNSALESDHCGMSSIVRL
jgi:hypothetical protein